MPQLKHEEIRTLQEYTEVVQNHVKTAGNILWFRGSGRYTYDLKPSLFRHSTTDIVELLKLEKQLMTRFHQRGYPFVQKPFPEQWERLFFMQHYGLPTRLLDWSESPHVALYFALDSATKRDNGDYHEDVAVWVMDPTKWNRFLYPRLGDNIDILTSTDTDQLERYAPPHDPETNTLLAPPIAMYGTHNSQRIVSQRGVFVMFGSSSSPMEYQYENYIGKDIHGADATFPEGLLLKIKIPLPKIDDLKEELKAIGLTHSVIYPDLEGLAKETRRFFGYTG